MTFQQFPLDPSRVSPAEASAAAAAIGDQTGTGTRTNTTTGSWADSTHSVIWMTRGGHRPSALITRAAWIRHLTGLAVVALLTLLAVSNLVDVYGDAAVWAVAAVPATLLGCLIALAGVKQPLRLWWQIVFLALAQFIVGPVVALNDTAIGHVVPSIATLSQGWQDTFGSFKYLISITPPVGAGSGALMAVWTLSLWTAFLAGLFAVADDGRLSTIGALPVFAAFAAAALLGTSTGWWRYVAGLAAALVLVVWLAARWGLLEIGRWLSSLVIVVLAAGLAVGACLAMPQNRLILRDEYEPPLSPYDYTSPLSGLRSYIKDHKDDTVLTARNLPEGTPVRLAVMDRFDGNVWNLSDSSAAADSSNYRRVGTAIANDTKGDQFTATFTVGEGLADRWLPLSGAATKVTFDDAGKTSATTSGKSSGTSGTATEDSDGADAFYYNTDTDSAIYPSGTSKGLTYTETGVIQRTPSDKQIDAAKAATITQPEVTDSPDSAGKLATALAGGEAKGGAAARKIADELKDSGWFSHGLSGDYPSLPGHGNYRIEKLLGGKEMVGDSEQYASAMALMARDLGLPSRVVLGFIPKNKDGAISAARTEKRGKQTVTEFKGNDIEAWVEIKLDGYGWVAFYPTPKETKIPDKNQNLTPPNPQTLVRQPPVPLQDPLRDEQQARGQSALAGEDADASGANLFWARVGRIARRVAIYGSPVWTVLIVCGLILLVKAIQLSRARRRGSPRVRVAAGWRALTALARQSGVDAHGTRREEGHAMAEQLAVDATNLTRLSRDADYAAFSGQQIGDEQARRYWSGVDATRKAMLASMPRLRRWRTRLSLAGVFTRRRKDEHGTSATGIVASMRVRFAGRGTTKKATAGKAPGARTEGKRS
ncbi:DUF3488 and transglutaminase-like domain-containing protein [Bifidobacterium stellenboschense]|uniref:Transglutaminase n=1 Tax=Bifidobacterium stellenboschense TaxID=762211 RepID=A0A087DE29_9BIFI|nr:transglutaminase [Bifidobacterium stellenboschense]